MTAENDFEQALFRTLLEDPALSACVQGRIFALAVPSGTALPCVSFQRVDSSPANTLEGRSGLWHITLQVDAWGRTYAEAKAAARAVLSAMPERGEEFGARLSSDAGLYESGTNYFRISMEFSCWFLEQE